MSIQELDRALESVDHAREAMAESQRLRDSLADAERRAKSSEAECASLKERIATMESAIDDKSKRLMSQWRSESDALRSENLFLKRVSTFYCLRFIAFEL